MNTLNKEFLCGDPLMAQDLNDIINLVNNIIGYINSNEEEWSSNNGGGTTLNYPLDNINSAGLSTVPGEDYAIVSSSNGWKWKLVTTGGNNQLGLNGLDGISTLLAFFGAVDDVAALTAVNAIKDTLSYPPNANFSATSNITLQQGLMLYMTSAKRRGDSLYISENNRIWLEPVRIGSGSTTSTTGTDDDNYNYIYCRTKEYITPGNLDGTVNTSNYGILILAAIENDTGRVNGFKYINGNCLTVSNIDSATINNIDGAWTDHPRGISPELPYEWLVGFKKGSNDNWEYYFGPICISHWGHNGLDGDGYEYIYYLLPENQSGAPSLTAPYNGSVTINGTTTNYTGVAVNSPNYLQDDFIPTGWHDEPLSVSSAYPRQYCSTRRKDGALEAGDQWQAFTEPKLWSIYASSGSSMTIDNDTIVLDDETGSDAVEHVSLTKVHLWDGLDEITFAHNTYEKITVTMTSTSFSSILKACTITNIVNNDITPTVISGSDTKGWGNEYIIPTNLSDYGGTFLGFCLTKVNSSAQLEPLVGTVTYTIKAYTNANDATPAKTASRLLSVQIVNISEGGAVYRLDVTPNTLGVSRSTSSSAYTYRNGMSTVTIGASMAFDLTVQPVRVQKYASNLTETTLCIKVKKTAVGNGNQISVEDVTNDQNVTITVNSQDSNKLDVTFNSATDVPVTEVHDYNIELWYKRDDGDVKVDNETIDFSIQGDTGANGANGARGSFKSRVFCRSNNITLQNASSFTPTGGSYDNPWPGGENPHLQSVTINGLSITVTWHDGIPSGNEVIWSSVCTFNDNNTSSGWSSPSKESDSVDLDIEFSPSTSTTPSAPGQGTLNENVPFSDHSNENPAWYDPTRDNLPNGLTWEDMIWRAERKVKNGSYDGPWVITRIKGEKGDPGTGQGQTGQQGPGGITIAITPSLSAISFGVDPNTNLWTGDISNLTCKAYKEISGGTKTEIGYGISNPTNIDGYELYYNYNYLNLNNSNLLTTSAYTKYNNNTQILVSAEATNGLLITQVNFYLATGLSSNVLTNPLSVTASVPVLRSGKKGLDGLNSTGQVGKFYYYAGDWETEVTNLEATSTKYPYVKYHGNFYMYIGGEHSNGAKNSFLSNGSSDPSDDSTNWEIIQYNKYLINDAIFSKYAELGSMVINQDWLISKYGEVGGAVNTNYENFNPIDFMSYLNKAAYIGIVTNSSSGTNSQMFKLQRHAYIELEATGTTRLVKIKTGYKYPNSGTLVEDTDYDLVGEFSGSRTGNNKISTDYAWSTGSMVVGSNSPYYCFIGSNITEIKILYVNSEDITPFIPNYALDLRSGFVYLNNAYIRGEFSSLNGNVEMREIDNAFRGMIVRGDNDKQLIALGVDNSTGDVSEGGYISGLLTVVGSSNASHLDPGRLTLHHGNTGMTFVDLSAQDGYGKGIFYKSTNTPGVEIIGEDSTVMANKFQGIGSTSAAAAFPNNVIYNGSSFQLPSSAPTGTVYFVKGTSQDITVTSSNTDIMPSGNHRDGLTNSVNCEAHSVIFFRAGNRWVEFVGA